MSDCTIDNGILQPFQSEEAMPPKKTAWHKNPSITVPIIATIVLGAISTYGTLVLNQRIDDRIDKQLDNHGFKGMQSDVAALNTDVAVMKSTLEDLKGYVRLLTEKALETHASQSNVVFQKQLPEVATALGAASASNAIVPASTVRKLEDNLTTAVAERPSSPIAWQAAFRFITYRSGVNSQSPFVPIKNVMGKDGKLTNSPYCTDQSLYYNVRPSLDRPLLVPHITYIEPMQFTGCILVLDDLEAFENSPAWQGFLKHKQDTHAPANVTYDPILVLKNVKVIYRGGELPPVGLITFEHCFFEWQPTQSLPSAAGRLLTASLLRNNLPSADVELSRGDAS